MNKLFILPITLGVFVLAMTVAFAQVALGNPVQGVVVDLEKTLTVSVDQLNLDYGTVREGQMSSLMPTFTLNSQGSNVNAMVSTQLVVDSHPIFGYIKYDADADDIFETGIPATLVDSLAPNNSRTVKSVIDLTSVNAGTYAPGADLSGTVEFIVTEAA